MLKADNIYMVGCGSLQPRPLSKLLQLQLEFYVKVHEDSGQIHEQRLKQLALMPIPTLCRKKKNEKVGMILS